jgi:hypothetical protein
MAMDLLRLPSANTRRIGIAHDWVSDATLTPVFQSLPGASFIVNGSFRRRTQR